MKRSFYDNTELACHKTCPRKYYFRHIEALRREGPTSSALVFGTAWHRAMDEVWRLICIEREKDDVKVLRAAYNTWEHSWIEEGMPHPALLTEDMREDLNLGIRNPDTAIEMLMAYIQKRRVWLETKVEELLFIEQPFAVPLRPNDDQLWYCGRWDKVARIEGSVDIIDHKTTTAYKKDGFFRASFIESFSPNSQVEGYSYAAALRWPKEFGRVWIDGALVHKTVHEFCLVPVQRSYESLDGWLYNTLEEIRRIVDYRTSLDLTADQPYTYLPTFPQNTEGCWSFESACSFLDLCKGMPNPRSFIQENGTPPGYQIERWSPFSKNQMESLGFSPDEVEHG